MDTGDVDGVPDDGVRRIKDKVPDRLGVARFMVELGFLLQLTQC